MPIRELTEEEIKEVSSSQIREISKEELERVEELDTSVLDAFRESANRFSQRDPEGPPAPESKTLVQRAVQRFTGEDVEDPESLSRLGTTVAGGFSGGIAGSRATAAGGPLLQAIGTGTGGVVGTVAGAIAPEYTVEFLEKFGLLPKGSREKFGLTDAQLWELAYGEALIEVATLGTFSGGKVASRLFARQSTGLTKETNELADALAKQGIDITPFQLGDRVFGNGLVNVLGRFPLIGGKTKARGKLAVDQTLKVTDELPERIGNLFASTELGVRIFNEATNLVKGVGNQFNEAYTNLFRKAKDADVVLDAQTLLATKTAQRTLLVEKRAGKGSAAIKQALKFIDEELESVGQLTFEQADDLAKNIDQFINSQPEAIRKQVGVHLGPFRDALKFDLAENLGVVEIVDGVATINKGNRAAREVSRELQNIDAEFNQTMAALFETSTAKRFGSVQRGGLRTSKGLGELTTNIPVDQLASKVINLDSPQAVDELFRLISPQTRRDVASKMIADQFGKAVRTNNQGQVTIAIDTLKKNLGLTKGTGHRREAITKAIKHSGLEFDELERLIEGVEKITSTPIPDFSTFIARRATIGGARGAVGGITGHLANTFVGSLMFLGGARMLVDAVGNPKHTRALKVIMNQEASEVVKRAAFTRLVGGVLEDRGEVGELTRNQVRAIKAVSFDLAKELFKEKE